MDSRFRYGFTGSRSDACGVSIVRVGDRILVVYRKPVYAIDGMSTYLHLTLEHTELLRARVERFSFDRGKRRIFYRVRAGDIKRAGNLLGKDEGEKWVRGWDLDSPQACALRVALAL